AWPFAAATLDPIGSSGSSSRRARSRPRSRSPPAGGRQSSSSTVAPYARGESANSDTPTLSARIPPSKSGADSWILPRAMPNAPLAPKGGEGQGEGGIAHASSSAERQGPRRQARQRDAPPPHCSARAARPPPSALPLAARGSEDRLSCHTPRPR